MLWPQNETQCLSDNKIYFYQEHMLTAQNVSEEEEVEMTTLEHFGLLLTKVINKQQNRDVAKPTSSTSSFLFHKL